MRSGRLWIYCLAFATAPLLVGCRSVDAPPPGNSAGAQAIPAPPAPGVIGAAIGQTLDDTDRTTAVAGQQEAVSTGNRRSWRGGHGSYGFITPGPETAGCREYTHRIFINGRPQEAKGRACQDNGAWRVTN